MLDLELIEELKYIYIYIYCRGSVQMIWPLMKESTWMEARYN